MRKMLTLLAVVYSASAFAQGTPLTAGDKPAARVKPHAAAMPTTPKSVAAGLLGCLSIDDGTKGRLDCYDAVVPPKPKPKAPVAKGVLECRYYKEEDDRLACFNDFAERIPKFS